MSSFSSKEEEEEEEEEAYNEYIRRDGIHEKLKTKMDIKFKTKILEKVYERTRRRIREKGGMIKHDDAMRAVVVEEGRSILEEIYDEAARGIAKSNPLLSEALRSKDENIRKIAQSVLFSRRRRTEEGSKPD